jgi:nucleoside-diphosphate-sugar epimerase
MSSYGKVCITGYSGFLGSGLLAGGSCQTLNSDTILIGRKPSDSGQNWLYWDLLDPFRELGLRIAAEDRNLLLHYAAQLPQGHTPDYQLIEKNERLFLLNCAHCGITDIVYASSGAVYGFSTERLSERHPLKPEGPYAAYKLRMERFIAQLWPSSHLILRYFFPFGPGQKKPRLIPSLIEKINAYQEISLSGRDTGLIYNPIYIEDATEAASWLIDNKLRGIFNLAGQERISVKEAVFCISRHYHTVPKLSYTNEPEPVLIGSIDKLLRLNPHLIHTPLHDAMLHTLAAKDCPASPTRRSDP